MTALRRLFRIVTLTTLVACSHGSADDRGPTNQPALAGTLTRDEDRFRFHADGKDAAENRAIAKPDDGRKVIRTGRIELVVASYDGARAKIDALLAQAGGFVDSTNVTHRAGEVSDATIVVRIPADGMGSLLPKLREIGEIVSESTSASDITDQYVDVEARLASKKALEKRLLELAANPNGNITDVLAVERELASVRGEIEGYEGQIRQWKDRVSMSTLTLQLSTKRPELVAAAPPTLGERIGDGFHDSVAALRDAGTWLAVHAIAVLPWLVFAIPGLLLLRRVSRRVKLPWAIARKAANVEPDSKP